MLTSNAIYLYEVSYRTETPYTHFEIKNGYSVTCKSSLSDTKMRIQNVLMSYLVEITVCVTKTLLFRNLKN